MKPDPPEPDPLTRVRREIESIDRTIVLLLAARLDAAGRALRMRFPRERRLTDQEQQRRVLERGRAWARELGLPPDLVQHLFQALVEEGKVRFRRTEGAEEESPIVTVFLAPPKGSAAEPRRVPRPELVPVPAPA